MLRFCGICAIQPPIIHTLILASAHIHIRMLVPTRHWLIDPDYISWFCPSWISRWATYSKGGFKEGVSLSVDDELNRWQKYSYGCNKWVFSSSIHSPWYHFSITHFCLILHRMLFNPIVQWWRRGPINRQIHKFLWSQAPLHYKISMMAGMCLFCLLHLNPGLMNQCVRACVCHLIGYRHVLVM